MALPATEIQHEKAAGLDLRSDAEILDILREGQAAALGALTPALPALAKGADLMAQALRGPGRLIYAAAGSSGLMALADAAELGGTFGIPASRIRILMAGGLPTGPEMPGDTEDDARAAERAARDLTADDTLIALTASGSTAYPLTLARLAREKGARTVCIANNPGAPIFAFADAAICLATPPEVIAGSTRMGAGTAQKAALNMMSTLMGLRLGHVHDGLMVSVLADNAKLRQRAARMVAQIAGVPDDRAQACLEAAQGAVKPAVLLALGASDLATAKGLLDAAQGHLRAALARLTETGGETAGSTPKGAST